MIEEWVKCHSSLCQGFWSGVPRSTRFVLLELALLARPRGGEFDLPFGTTDPVEAIVDLLARSARKERKEVREAVRILTSPSVASVEVSSEAGRFVVRLPNFQRWNRPASSTERSRASRAKAASFGDAPEQNVSRADRELNRKSQVPASFAAGSAKDAGRTDSEPCATSEQLREHHAQPGVAEGNACNALEERRGEEKRRDPPTPPERALFELEPSQADPADELWAHYLARRRAVGLKRVIRLTSEHRANIHRRLKSFAASELRAAINVLLAEDSFWLRTKNTSPEYWLRSDRQVEKLLERAQDAAPERPPPPPGYDEEARLRELRAATASKPKAPTVLPLTADEARAKLEALVATERELLAQVGGDA